MSGTLNDVYLRKPKILTGKHTGSRPLGRSRHTWEDNIGINFKEIGVNMRSIPRLLFTQGIIIIIIIITIIIIIIIIIIPWMYNKNWSRSIIIIIIIIILLLLL